MIISRRTIAKEKLEQLKSGYSAYAETNEVSQYLEKQIEEMGMNVVIDRTPQGNWFIPVNDEPTEQIEA